MTPQAYSLPYPPILWPQRLYMDNFAQAWGANHFSDYFINSLLVGTLSTALIILISTLAAYAFARMPGTNANAIAVTSPTVPTASSHRPAYAFASYQIASLLNVVGVRKPYHEFGLTRR